MLTTQSAAACCAATSSTFKALYVVSARIEICKPGQQAQASKLCQGNRMSPASPARVYPVQRTAAESLHRSRWNAQAARPEIAASL